MELLRLIGLLFLVTVSIVIPVLVFVWLTRPSNEDRHGFEVKPITDAKSVPETKENDHG